MTITEVGKLKDRVWLTERCHMAAEKRNRFLEFYFHITLALFALSSIFIALFQSEPNIPGFENVLTFTSICTLSISLLIFGFAFGETAAKHRSCYLDLQRLRLEALSTEDKLNEKYIDTLSYYPNHSTLDYMQTCISNVFTHTQSLKDPNGNHITFSIWTRLLYSLSWVLTRIVAIAFTLSPVIVALFSI
jgi:hypothetical protein